MRGFEKSSLRWRLLLIASAAIIPLAVVCGIALHGLLGRQYEQTEASTLGVARALATAVDSELRLTIATLQSLALTEPLGTSTDEGLSDARDLTRAVRASHPEWRGLLLVAPSGKVVFSTDQDGPGVAEAIDKDSLAEALNSGQPVVGPMVRGPGGNLAFAVRVPVMREGAVKYLLTAIVRPEAITAVLRRQRVPDGWTVSVFDSKNARIARTVDDDLRRGTAPTETLLVLLRTMGDGKEIVGSSTTIDNVRVQTAVARIDTARWIVALGASVATAESAWRRTMLAYGGGLLFSLCLGAIAAWWMSRSITRPMASLRRDADALGQGELPVAQGSGIAEVDAVADALAAAAVQRKHIEAEREQSLVSERNARTVAEAAERRLERLVRASAQLSRSLEETSTLAAIAEVIVPDVADLCRIDLLDDKGVLLRKLTHHVDPVRGAQIARMVSSRTAPSDAPGSFPWAIETGRTFLHNIEDPDMPEINDAQLRDFVRAFGISAACVVPLVARGRTLGAMAVLQADSGRRFTADDGVLIGELAQRAALALDNVRLLADARVAQAEAEAANQAKDEFLAMLGHELRNPLAPISLALQLMARRDADAFPRERQIIERQVKHLSRMVDDLLDVSRIVSGKIALKLETVDLRDVVARAIELTLPALQQRAAMPELALPESAVPVRGDPSRLVQIVCNLLNNSAKFTPTDKAIRVSLKEEGDRAVLTVADEGIGIARALLPRVFERFVQGEQPLQRASGGLGLGLAIAKSLASLHGGTIRAASDGEGRGSAFTVELPLFAETPADDDAIAASPANERKLRVLLVDDNTDAVDALADWFALEGHEVRTANSAEEALDRLDESGGDAAVFDIGLPGMSGYDLARRVRSDPRTRAMALVALTGYGRETDRQHALEAGFDDHFAKPAQVELLLQRLQQLVMRAA